MVLINALAYNLAILITCAFVTVSHFHPCLILVCNLETYLGRLLALSKNIKLGWKEMVLTNALAYTMSMLITSAFVTARHFHPSIIFVVKARCFLREASRTMLEIADNFKHMGLPMVTAVKGFAAWS